MTMHLAHPALSTTGKRKGKQKWASAEHKRKAEMLDQEWQELQKKWGIEAEERKRSRALKAKPFVPKVNPRLAELRTTASLPETHVGAVTVKQTPQYTGDKIVGISTLHKSNAIPVFSRQEAIDVSKMRR